MLKQAQGNREIIEKRSGGGLLVLFGLLFTGVGLFLLTLPFGGPGPTGSAAPVPVRLLFTLVFSAVGLALIFYRRGISLDRRHRITTVWWGFPMPLRQTPRAWAEFTLVALTREIRKSKNSTYTVYPVRAIGQGKPLKFEEPQDYQAARRTAEQVAEFMGLPLHDSSSGHAVIRQPGELNEPLGHRLKRTGDPATALPAPPAGMRSRLFQKDRSVLMEIPAPPPNPLLLIALIGSVGFTLFIIFGFLLAALPPIQGISRSVLGTVLIAVLVGPEIGFAAFLWFGRRQPTRLTVSPAGLRFETIGLMGIRAEEFPASQLEELEVQRTEVPPQLPAVLRIGLERGILARSDAKSIEFGQTLSEEEKLYLTAVIRHVLVS